MPVLPGYDDNLEKKEFFDQARQGEDRARGDQIAAGGLPGQPAADFQMKVF